MAQSRRRRTLYQKACASAIVIELVVSVHTCYRKYLLDAPPVLWERLSFPCLNRGSVYLRAANRSVTLRTEDVTKRRQHRVNDHLKCVDNHARLENHVQEYF